MDTIYLSPSIQENNIGYGNYGYEFVRMNQITDVIEDNSTYTIVKIKGNWGKLKSGISKALKPL